jgi:hypothetical protein
MNRNRKLAYLYIDPGAQIQGHFGQPRAYAESAVTCSLLINRSLGILIRGVQYERLRKRPTAQRTTKQPQDRDVKMIFHVDYQ